MGYNYVNLTCFKLYSYPREVSRIRLPCPCSNYRHVHLPVPFFPCHHLPHAESFVELFPPFHCTLLLQPFVAHVYFLILCP